MKIFIAIKSAALRSLKTWKGVLIIWLLSLLVVSMVAVPMKGALNAGFGKSMITGKLLEGVNLEVFADLGDSLKGLVAFFRTGLFLAIIISFILNAFFTGGLFTSLKSSAGQFSVSEFLRTSAKYFWSYFVILLIISMILLFLAVVVIIIPLAALSQKEGLAEGTVLKSIFISFSVFFLLAVILFLVADYARAWQVANEKNGCFRAIGFGFGQTFRTFFSSYPLMIIILIFQILFGWFVLSILPGITPASGGGVFLFLLFSQLMYFITLMLKVWRYGSVTKLMELTINAQDNSKSGSSLSESPGYVQ